MTDHSFETVASVVGSITGAKQYRPYSAYKDSGVEWLGKIPTNWEVAENRWLFRESDSRSEYGEEELLTVSHISGVTRRTDKPDVTMMEAASHEGYKLCGCGDLAINTMWAWMGVLGVACEDGMVSPSYNVYCTNLTELVPSYYDYLCRVPTHIVEITRHSKGIWSSRLRLYPDTFRNIQTPVPPKSDQRRIADFLGRETAKIDAMVATKERLIELLQEKRMVLITQSVTNGINPDAPMKDSGVEWFGEIPAHWDVKLLRQAVTFQRGHDLPSDKREEGNVPVISSSGFFSKHSKPIAEAPGIVTGRYGTIGQFHQINEAYWPLNTTLYSIDMYGNEPRFLMYMLIHMSHRFLLHALKSAVPGVDRNDVHADHCAVPLVAEQRVIADFLDRETANIDALVAKVREAIDGLKELRTALISAAVTGKIDVREAVP